jgi:hypothetical protein
MWFLLGFFVGVYVPVTFAGLMPDWAHAGLFMMAWMALGYSNELARLVRGKESAKAEPLSKSEAFGVQARFARTRREEALRRKQRWAWQRAAAHGPKVAGTA